MIGINYCINICEYGKTSSAFDYDNSQYTECECEKGLDISGVCPFRDKDVSDYLDIIKKIYDNNIETNNVIDWLYNNGYKNMAESLEDDSEFKEEFFESIDEDREAYKRGEVVL